MFPIQNNFGQIIGFGGRVIDNQSIKYMNSPESFILIKVMNCLESTKIKNTYKKKMRLF